MSHQKDKHYWTQLRSALAAGQWSAQYPAKAPNGIALSWSELFRKFNKHCRGFNDVSEVASQTQALALLLAANSKDEDQDNAVEGTQYPLDLGNECVLPEERVDEASAGYEVLKRLESSNFDVSCPDCMRTLNHEYPSIDAQLCSGILCICPWKPVGMSCPSQQSSRCHAPPEPHTSAEFDALECSGVARAKIGDDAVFLVSGRKFRVISRFICAGDQGRSRVGND